MNGQQFSNRDYIAQAAATETGAAIIRQICGGKIPDPNALTDVQAQNLANAIRQSLNRAYGL